MNDELGGHRNSESSLAEESPASDVSSRPNYVVGVGASAGGLEAIEALFGRIPAVTGMAFVVVQHLSPEFKSYMDEIIRRRTEMAVFRVSEGMPVRANAIYLIPPGKEMIISDGCLLLSDKDPNEALTLPIDHFFRSLAYDCGSRAIAVVLSGSGSDGSRGVRDVHQQGGLVMCQSPITSGFDGMPNSTMGTGVVDLVGSPVEIAEALLKLVQHPMQRGEGVPRAPIEPEDSVQLILREIRTQYGIDFTYYKPTTVMRRIERRLLLNHSDNLDQYVGEAIGNSEELNLLYKDLLIGVTQFFRDVEAYRVIEEQVIDELLSQTPPGREIRIWSAGCATGEEPYSLAMLLHERCTAMGRPVNARIFATDVHRESLESAALGIYDAKSMVNVSPERTERFFAKVNEGWRVSPEIRNMVVFASHNLIKDAPFTRMDLVCCRNMLIYLQPLAQRKVISLFHFALRANGVLFLGPSETPCELGEEFEEIDARWRIWKKRRDIRLSQVLRLPPGDGETGRSNSIEIPTTTSSSLIRHSDRTRERSGPLVERDLMHLYESVLKSLVPMGFLMNEANELLHSFGDINSIVRFPSGRVSNNLLDMLPSDLRTLLIGAIQKAARTDEIATFDRVKVNSVDSITEYHVTVKQLRLQSSGKRYTFVSFLPLETVSDQVAVDGESGPVANIDELALDRIRVLETELRHSRENLQATIEELESSNEELQATNEEMVASNEELQSTNEELHSVNEELYTVNAEYQKKISELTELSHDMDNLLTSTDVHTLFLDEQLFIRKFTPRMGVVFNLIGTDVGRNIRGFSHNIPCDDLLGKITQVVDNGGRYDEEIAMSDGSFFLLRILPYRNENEFAGVVLTLVEITESKEAEARFRATFDTAAVGIAHIALDGKWLRVNDRLCSILGYSRKELLTKTFQDITYPKDADLNRVEHQALIRGDLDRYSVEKRYIGKDGNLVWVSKTVALQRGLQGQPQYAIAVVQDIAKRKTFESGLERSIEQRDRFLATLSHELRNPLAAVRHAIKLFRHSRSNEQQRSIALRTIERQTGQMAFLLDDLLDVSRITQGKIVYDMRPLDLREVLQDAVDALRPTFEEHSHTLQVKIPKKPVVVMGDVSRLMQVIENLLTNACKYTDPGGQIDITLRRYDGWGIFKVRDNGRGIESQDVENVFDMFVQSDIGLARREGGMGLGLTVVKSLVESHQGTITARSPGKGLGSTFTVRMPLSAELPTELPEELPEENPIHASEPAELIASASGRPIVLVEDNDDAREMLTDFLELEGFSVVACADGNAGLEELVKQNAAIALVDLGLPGLDGYQVARRFRQQCGESEMFLISLSGYGQTADIIKSEEAGFDRHLTKPIDPDELAEILRSLGV